jgi:hypothetical protein
VELEPESAGWPRRATAVTAGCVFGAGDSSSHRLLVSEALVSPSGPIAIDVAVPAEWSTAARLRLELWWTHADTGTASLAGRFEGALEEGSRVVFYQGGREQGAARVSRVELHAPRAEPPRGSLERPEAPAPPPDVVPWVEAEAEAGSAAELPPPASQWVGRYRQRRAVPLARWSAPVEAYYASLLASGREMLEGDTAWVGVGARAACLLANNRRKRPGVDALGIFLMLRNFCARYTPDLDARDPSRTQEQFSSTSATPRLLAASEGDDCDGFTSSALEMGEALRVYQGDDATALALQDVLRGYTVVALDVTTHPPRGKAAPTFHAVPALVQRGWLAARRRGRAWRGAGAPVVFLESALVACHAEPGLPDTWLWPRVCATSNPSVMRRALSECLRVLSRPEDTAVGRLYEYVFALYDPEAAERLAVCGDGRHGVLATGDLEEAELLPDPTPGCATAEKVRTCAAYALGHRPAPVPPAWQGERWPSPPQGVGEWVVERGVGLHASTEDTLRTAYASAGCRRGLVARLGPACRLAWLIPK